MAKAKNDFTKTNSAKRDTGVNEGAALDEIARANSSKKKRPVSKQEQEARKATLRTQGIKGCKLPRINMAFTPDNHQFIKVMAKVTGQSMTEVINIIIERYRAEHGGLYEKATELYNEFIGVSDNE